ncbi:hypothetical protein ACWGB8_07340 [Kitasatospora sp. NPDC054939]
MLTAAVSFVLTAGGVAVSGLRAFRRRWRSAVRWFAVALLPAGLYLAGLFPLATTIAGALGDWATDLVFKPTVWIGLALLAVSGGMLATTRWADRRRAAVQGGAAAGAAGGTAGVDAAAARPAVAPAAAPKAKRSGRADTGLGEFADVEEILRRRGI